MRSHHETRWTALRSCGWQRCDPNPRLLSWSFLAGAPEVSWTLLQLPTNKPKGSQSLPRYIYTDWQIELIVFIHYIRILSSVTMPTCDVLRHFRKMLLRVRIRGCTLASLIYSWSPVVYTQSEGSILLWYKNDWRSPITVGELNYSICQHFVQLFLDRPVAICTEVTDWIGCFCLNLVLNQLSLTWAVLQLFCEMSKQPLYLFILSFVQFLAHSRLAMWTFIPHWNVIILTFSGYLFHPAVVEYLRHMELP